MSLGYLVEDGGGGGGSSAPDRIMIYCGNSEMLNDVVATGSANQNGSYTIGTTSISVNATNNAVVHGSASISTSTFSTKGYNTLRFVMKQQAIGGPKASNVDPHTTLTITRDGTPTTEIDLSNGATLSERVLDYDITGVSEVSFTMFTQSNAYSQGMNPLISFSSIMLINT